MLKCQIAQIVRVVVDLKCRCELRVGIIILASVVESGILDLGFFRAECKVYARPRRLQTSDPHVVLVCARVLIEARKPAIENARVKWITFDFAHEYRLVLSLIVDVFRPFCVKAKSRVHYVTQLLAYNLRIQQWPPTVTDSTLRAKREENKNKSD